MKARRLKPDALVGRLRDITPPLLHSLGVRGLLLDLDNTLLPYRSDDDAQDAAGWVHDMRAAGLGLYLLSNARRERAARWAAALGVQGVGMAGKPLPRAFRAGARALGLPPAEVAVVGDQLFTDVLGGKLCGMRTVLVRPISDNNLPHTRLARTLERRVLRGYGLDWHSQPQARDHGNPKEES